MDSVAFSTEGISTERISQGKTLAATNVCYVPRENAAVPQAGSTQIGAFKKSREIQNHHMDSTIWNEFALRPDDIIIATYMKTGTTWMQQIVAQLLSGGSPNVSPAARSPWLEYRILDRTAILAKMAAQSDRRFLKTHLPADALVYSPEVKYIYIARDGRDVLQSIYHHYSSIKDETFVAINDTPGRIGPPLPKIEIAVRDYFLRWLEGDGYPFWPFWDHIRSWWSRRHLPNVLLVHHGDLTSDLAGEIQRIANFLGIAVDESRWDAILKYSSIEHMQSRAADVVPRGGAAFVGGAKTFLENGGVNGRWRGELTDGDCALYERTALKELGGDCAKWLANGTLNRMS